MPGADEAKAERLHPLSLLSGLGRAARNVIGGIAAGGFLAFQGRFLIALLVLGGIAVASLAGLLLHWWNFSFRVGRDAIRIDSGALNRNHRTIPFDRVADVSISQGPLQRVAGIARVTLETGGGGSDDGVLDGIPLQRAEALREFIRARRSRAPASAGALPAIGTTQEPAPLFAMDIRRVLTLGLFNFSLALFAGLFGASQTFGDMVDIDPFERNFWRPILEQSGWGAWLLAHQIGLALGGVAVLLLAGIVTGVVRTVLRETGFRLDRTGNGFRRRRGLLTKTDVSLPLKRIQAALIATGPVREHFGWRAFKVVSLAGESGTKGQPGTEDKRDHVLAPLATTDELAPIAGEIGLALPGPDTPWRPVSKRHVGSFLAFVGPLMLLIASVSATALLLRGEPNAGASIVPPIAAGIGFLVLWGLRWLEWQRTAYAVEGQRLLIRSGWWSRKTFLIPLRNIQSVTLHENSLGRKFGIATLAIDVAGGRSTGQRIPSLPRNEASLVRTELLSRQP
ncbi:PH domain-containing protein [Sphingomonas sp. LHG3406-1]|uniref:PH domain-containing protein n=1 Tax=Sphingomonas sp. LHG3406-1 TaxID=2804617 RepID=UPI00262CA9F5|nr:PH domain-containing protein [Sphingomonas sp. LHG3406-1]